MRKVAGYLANVGKSITYSAVDKLKDISPATGELVESNSELYKSVYSSIRDYRVTYKRGLDSFKKSKVYEAADVLKSNLIEDISSGKFYNKDRDSSKYLGLGNSGSEDMMDMGDFDGLDIDFGDWGIEDESGISNGDKIVSSTISSSNRKTAEMISTVTARSSEYIVESQKMNTNLLYTQNLQNYQMMNSGLTSINENLGGIISFSNDVIKTHVDNSANYFQETTKLLQDQTALLREIATSLGTQKKEEKTRERITYDDIVGASGTPDIGMYLKSIKQNISNNSATGMLSSFGGMFGEDSNMLAALAENPLQFIPKKIIDTLIPKTIEKSMESFDKSLSALFASSMVKINTIAQESESPIAKTLAQIFGVKSNIKSTLDTRNYEKGKVDWDGKSRKALIEVIPTQLGKIVSLLSGKSEKIYDYEQGTFVEASTLKKQLDTKTAGYAKAASGDMRDFMEESMKLLTFNSKRDREQLTEDMTKFFEKLYSENRLFNVNSSTIDTDHMDYNMSSKNFKTIRAMFKNAPMHMQQQLNADIMETRSRHANDFENLEKSDDVLKYLFNNSNIDEFVSKNKLTKSPKSPLMTNLVDTVDNRGRNVFYYLQNIYKELSFMRQYRNYEGRANNNKVASQQIEHSSGVYIPEVSMDNIVIPHAKAKTANDEEAERKQRERDRFVRNEESRRRKNDNLINFSSTDDDDIENAFSSMLKTEELKRSKLEEKQMKPNLFDKLLEATSLNEKTKIMTDKISELYDKPIKFVTDTIDKVDRRMYEFIYGKKDDNGNDIKGFLELSLYELKSTFGKFNTFLDEKILEPLKNKFEADSVKDIGKKLLEGLGIDTDHIKNSVNEVFKEIGTKLKDQFTSVTSIVKESVSKAFAPVGKVFKDVFKSKPKSPTQIDEELDTEEYIDDYGDKQTLTRSQAISQQIIAAKFGINKKRKASNYYDNFDFSINKDTASDYYNNLVNSNYNPEDEEEYIKFMTNEVDRLTKSKGRISEINSILNNTRLHAKDKNPLIAELNSLLGDKDLNNLDKYKTDLDRSSYTLNNYKESYKVLQDKSANKFSDFYSNEFGIDSEMMDAVIKGMRSRDKGNNINKLTAKDMYDSANRLFKSELGGDVYKKVMDNLINISDSDYNSNIDMTIEEMMSNKKGKNIQLRDENNTSKKLSHLYPVDNELPKTSEEFFEAINYKGSILDPLTEVEEKQTTTLQSILTEIKDIKSMFSPKTQSTGMRPFGPRIGLNPEIMGNPEGKAMNTFAQDLVSMITNWMYGNIHQFDKGGYIDRPMVATVGEGEVVLSADNVERLTTIFNDLIGNIKKRTGKKEMTKSFSDSLQSLNIDGVESVDLPELFNSFVKNDEELNKQRADMGILNLSKYKDIIRKAGKGDTQNNDEVVTEESLGQRIRYEFTKDFTEVKTALFGESPEKEKMAFGEVVDDTVDNFRKYAPDMVSTGILGAGVSLITGAIGGPLLGAAVGAGIGLSKNSKTMQKWLFGETINGERQGGLLSKSFMKNVDKYLPDFKTYGITGTLAGMFTPLGPIGGLLTGSAFAFAKNNESVMKTLFGEEGLFKPESKDKFNKALPKIIGGAVIGGMVGPFGLLGNLALGSAAGFVTSTNDFRQALLGRYDEKDNKFKGGILPALRENLVDPLKDFGTTIKDNFVSNLKTYVFEPLTSAFDPIKKEVQLQFKSMFDKVTGFFKDSVKETFAPMTKWVEDKVVKRLSWIMNKFIRGSVGLAGKVATSPFRLIGGIGNSLRKKHIKNGNADYMSAQERLDYAGEKNISYNTDFDSMLANMTSEESSALLEQFNQIKTYSKSAKQLRKDIGRETGDNVATYVNYDTTKDIMHNIKYGNLDKALSIVGKKKLFGDKNKHGLNEDEQDKLRSYITDQYGKFHNAEKERDNVETQKKALYKRLRSKGIKVNDDNIDKYISSIKKESKVDKSKEMQSVMSPAEMVMYEETRDNHKTIVNLFNTAINAIKGIEENTDKIEDNQITEAEVAAGKARNGIPVTLSTGEVITRRDVNGDGVYEEPTDPHSADAMDAVREQDEERKTFFGRISNMLGFKNKDKDENVEKESPLAKIFSFVKGSSLAKTGLGIGAGILGVMNADKIASFVKDTVLPVSSEVMTTTVIPWVEKVGLPLFKDGLVGFAQQLPKLIIEGVKFGIFEIMPALLKGMWGIFKGDKSEDSFGESAKETVMREIATGGQMSKAGVSSANDIVQGIKGIGTSRTATEGARGILGTIAKPIGAIGRGITKVSSLPFKFGIKGAVNVAEKGVKGASAITSGISSKVGGVYKNINGSVNAMISNPTGAMSTIFGNVKHKLNGESTTALQTISNVANEENLVANAVNKLRDKFIELINNPIISKMIGPEAVEKLNKTLIGKFIDKVRKEAIKGASKAAARIAGFTTTGGLVNIAFAVGDFISGFNDAKNILGITEEPHIVGKVTCGLFKSIKNFFVIGCLIPESKFVDFLYDTLLEAFGIKTNLSDQRKEAKAKVDQYKKENGISDAVTVRDYNKLIQKKNREANPKDINGDGKVSIGDTFAKIGEKTKQIGTNIWNGIKSVGSSIGKAGKAVINGISKIFTGFGPGNASAGFGENDKYVGKGTGFPTHINNWKYYNQTDDQWNTSAIKGITVKAAGCGPTSIAMLLSQILNKNITPVDVATEGAKTGHWTSNGAMWTLFKHMGDKYGVGVQDAGTSFDKFKEFAAQGIPQAVSGRGSAPFTKGGHIITALGADKQGNVIINDPASTKNSRAWKFDEIKAAGWRNSWAYGGPVQPSAMGDTTTNNPDGQTVEQQTQAPKSGLQMLFDDIKNVATKSMDKIYGFDKIGSSNTTTNTESAGMGPDELSPDQGVNPLAATDFEGEPGLIRKLKSITKKNDQQVKAKPFAATSALIKRTKDKISAKLSDYMGQGGVDDPITNKGGKTVNALFTSYFPENSKLQGGFKDAMGNMLDPTKLTCAAPKSVPFGSKVQVKGTNTAKDGLVYTVNDRGGAIKIRGDEYQFDLLSPDKATAYGWGRKRGQAIITAKDGSAPNLAPGAEGSAEGANVTITPPEEGQSGFSAFMSDVEQLFNNSFNKLYGLDEILGLQNEATAEGSAGTNMASSELNTGAALVSDTWFGDTMKARMTSKFGPRRHPITGKQSHHNGIDYAAPSNTQIRTPIDGVVKSNAMNPYGMGNLLEIKDKNGGIHRFAHLVKKSHLSVGASVKSGDFVANVGSTGDSTGPHLHYEIRDTANKAVEPNGYLSRFFGSNSSMNTTNKSNGKAPTKENAKNLGANKSKTQPAKKPTTPPKGLGGNMESVTDIIKNQTGHRGGVDEPLVAPKIGIPTTPNVPPMQNSGSMDKQLMTIVINILNKIANNTNNLSDIVKLLTESLNVKDIPKDKLDKLASQTTGGNNNAQVINVIKQSMQDSKDPDSMYILKTLEALAQE